MSDSIKAWYEMQEENGLPINHVSKGKHELERVKYIYVLDFNDGKVYRYDISPLCNDNNKWNPDSESCEAFLIGAGHSIGNIEWMVVTNINSEVVHKLNTK